MVLVSQNLPMKCYCRSEEHIPLCYCEIFFTRSSLFVWETLLPKIIFIASKLPHVFAKCILLTIYYTMLISET